jgi:shikimate kinase
VSGHIVLIGLSGSGKSAIGRALAGALERPCYDTDLLLAARAGRPVPELLRSDAVRFRALEEEVVADACGAPAGVIATGGGVVLSPRNRDAIVQGNQVVWLRAATATLADRLHSGEERPLLEGDVAVRLAVLLAERETLYAVCAMTTIDTDDLTIEQSVARVRAALDPDGVCAWR